MTHYLARGLLVFAAFGLSGCMAFSPVVLRNITSGALQVLPRSRDVIPEITAGQRSGLGYFEASPTGRM